MLQLLFSIFLTTIVSVTQATRPSEAETIPIIVQENENCGGNRGGGAIPFSGFVDPSSGAAFLNFSQPCGVVYVSFSNFTNGDGFDITVNGNGHVTIPAILSPGKWRVTFILSSGAHYIGEFNY